MTSPITPTVPHSSPTPSASASSSLSAAATPIMHSSTMGELSSIQCAPTNSACVVLDSVTPPSSNLLTSLSSVFPSSLPAGGSGSGAGIASAPASCVSTINGALSNACPKPKHTLASTAKLFLPDQSSPILLAPSESEIHSDPTYYSFGSQLVAAIVLFFIAYAMAVVILSCVRRRERRAKRAWKATVQRERDLNAQVRIPIVRPTIYHVTAASAPMSLPAFGPSLDLMDPVQSIGTIANLKRKLQKVRLWLSNLPPRIMWRRDNNTRQSPPHKSAANRRTQSQLTISSTRLPHSSHVHKKHAASNPTPILHSVPILNSASRLARFGRFLHRNSPISLSSAIQSTSMSESASISPPPSSSSPCIDEEDSYQSLLDAFTNGIKSPLPWLTEASHHLDESPVSIQQYVRTQKALELKHNRKGSITETLGQFAAAIGEAAGVGAATKSKEEKVSQVAQQQNGGGRTRLVVSPSNTGLPPLHSLAPVPNFPHAALSTPVNTPSNASTTAISSDWLNNDLASSFPEEENNREFLTYSLATFVLSIALVWLELLVLSLVASTKVQGMALTDFYVASWCTKTLVSNLWIATMWLSSISLFILAPFGFLYYEAEGIGGRKGVVSRMIETMIVLSAFTVLLYGSFHLLQLLLDKGGLLSPFIPAADRDSSSDSDLHPITEEDDFFSFLNFVDYFTDYPALIGDVAQLIFDSLFSNIWHFLPGLILLLWTCHHGFIRLIASVYAVGANFERNFSVSSQSQKKSELNVIKLDLATAERRWEEMQRSIAARVARAAIGKHASTARAIEPTAASVELLAHPHLRTDAWSKKQRLELLKQIYQLREAYGKTYKELHESRPWYIRMFTWSSVRKVVWILAMLVAILLTWQIVLRVAQREARLIFRGSIFRWFRTDPSENPLMDSTTLSVSASGEAVILHKETTGIFNGLMRVLWGICFQLKNLLGLLLSLLTGRVIENRNHFNFGLSNNSTHNTTQIPSASIFHSIPFADDPPPFINGLFEFFRFFTSVLLGLNSFSHPGVAFIIDLSCIGFFFVSAAVQIFSSPFLEKFSPVYHLTHRNIPSLFQNPNQSLAKKLKAKQEKQKELASLSLLLFSPQFFTVNAALLLLLTSSLPLAIWMLGISHFELLEFYPQSTRHFGSNNSATIHVPLFVHLYNLGFLLLTGWHVSRISQKIFLWVLFDQIVASIELVVERIRVALGWARPNALPEERFKLFGKLRQLLPTTTSIDGVEWSRWQYFVWVFRCCFLLCHRIVSPFLRVGYAVIFKLAHALFVVLKFVWKHVHAFVSAELSDEDESKPSKSLAIRTEAGVDDTTLDEPIATTAIATASSSSSLLDDVSQPLLVRSESSMTAEVLAALDAVQQVDETAESAALDGEQADVVAPLPSPSGLRRAHHLTAAEATALGHVSGSTSGGLAYFSRSTSAPIPHMDLHDIDEAGDRYDLMGDELSDTVFTDVSTTAAALQSASTFGGSVDSLSQPPLGYSPLYRSKTMSSRMDRVPRYMRGDSYFMTPNLVPLVSRNLSTEIEHGEEESAKFSIRSNSSSNLPSATSSPSRTATTASSFGGMGLGGDSDSFGTPESARIVTEADFPQFADPIADPDALMENDEFESLHQEADEEGRINDSELHDADVEEEDDIPPSPMGQDSPMLQPQLAKQLMASEELGRHGEVWDESSAAMLTPPSARLQWPVVTDAENAVRTPNSNVRRQTVISQSTSSESDTSTSDEF